MILSITPNPSIDISYFLEQFQTGDIHRVQSMVKTPGGKGINVAKVLRDLDAQVTCTGFLGGTAGHYIEKSLQQRGIHTAFIPVEGETRSSYAIKDLASQVTTEIREQGPVVSVQAAQKLLDFVEKTHRDYSLISCSGSLPQGLSIDFLEALVGAAADTPIIFDVSGEALRKTVFSFAQKPYAIKPNIDELRDLFGSLVDKKSPEELVCMENLQEFKLVVLSLGKYGAVARVGQELYRCRVPHIEAVNPVGSGDASIAGLLFGLEQKHAPEKLLASSMAAGVLNALEAEIGHVDARQFETIRAKIQVKKLSREAKTLA